MNFNRKSMTRGLIGLGLVGALVSGGVVAAQAATGEGPVPQPKSTTSTNNGRDQFGHMADMGFGQNSPMTAVARYLGLSQTELHGRMQSGKSLADVAKMQGKPVSGLENAMVAALTTTLDSNGTLTPDQKSAAVKQIKDRIDTMVNAKGMGAGMGFGADTGMHAGVGSAGNPGMGSGLATTTM